jgi:hypothetical protein
VNELAQQKISSFSELLSLRASGIWSVPSRSMMIMTCKVEGSKLFPTEKENLDPGHDPSLVLDPGPVPGMFSTFYLLYLQLGS